MRQPKPISPIRITMTAVFMALNIILSSFGIPVPGGHLYLCDVVICLAAVLLFPSEAFIVGGIGSFFGDMLFYPPPMFVSLVTHGLQAVVISLIAHNAWKSRPRLASGIGAAVGVVIMVSGYTLGKTFIYSSWEYAVISFPYEAAQACIGAVCGLILCWPCGIRTLFLRITGNLRPNRIKRSV